MRLHRPSSTSRPAPLSYDPSLDGTSDASKLPKSLKLPEAPAPAELPRSRADDKSMITGGHATAVSAVLLGVQALGAIVASPAVAHAAPAPTEIDLSAIAEAAAALEGADMTDAERADARAALWAAYASAGVTDAAADTTTWSHAFETEWAAAKNKSVGADQVDAAVKELGTGATQEKLFELLDTYSNKLNAEGKQALRGAIATGQVTAAAQDGKVTKTEIETIETVLKGHFGAKAAEDAMISALPATIGTLESDAAAHLLQKLGSVDRHVGRLSMIADEMLEHDNTLIDANHNGKLDSGDVVFTKTADGAVKLETISKTFAQEATIANAIVDASYKMNSSGVSFQLIKNHKANSKYWDVGAGGVMTLKPGVKASEAVADMTKNGHKYGFECATGLVATYYTAMLDLLGPKDFDRVASDIRMGPWRMENDLDRVYVTSRPDPSKPHETDLKEDYTLVPGHYYYFENWDVTEDAFKRGWQGENVIYLGNGKFYGHGIGLGDADMFVTKLASEMKEGGKTPSLLNLHAKISTRIFDMDLHPGE